MEMEQINIRRSEHGGWMARLIGPDGRTVVAERTPTLGMALSWAHTLALPDQLYMEHVKQRFH
jgi:hypothetical protein